jgi:excisionase family DNA binding protein
MSSKKKASYNNTAVVLPPADAALLTVRETASVLRLSPSAIRAWILQKKIPYIKLHNKAVRIRRSDVDSLIAASLVLAVTNAQRDGRVA